LERKPEVKEASVKKQVENAVKTENAILVTRLVSVDGEKFWEISQNNEQLQIRFGKNESAGQVQIKTYANITEAELAKNDFIKEQISKGFNNV
jgi:predicted DNA-binding WGR domain protein